MRITKIMPTTAKIIINDVEERPGFSCSLSFAKVTPLSEYLLGVKVIYFVLMLNVVAYCDKKVKPSTIE